MTIGLIANNDGTGALQLGGSNAISLDTSFNATMAGSVNAPNTFAFKNRLINGAFQIAQRTAGGSATPAAGVTTYVSVDRWFLAQTGTAATLYCSQSTPQTTGVYKAGYFGRNNGQTNVPTNIFFGQQVESFNLYDLRGQTVTVSFNAFRGSDAPTALNVVARFGTAADEASANGLNGTWTGYTAASGSTLSIGTTVASYTYSFSVPSGASEMMLLFYYTPVGTASANEYFALENVQLEKGSAATSFDYRPYGTEFALCQRYFCEGNFVSLHPQASTAFGTTARNTLYIPPPRSTPVCTVSGTNVTSLTVTPYLDTSGTCVLYFAGTASGSATISAWTASSEL